MTEGENLVIARIVIERILRPDGTDVVRAISEDETGAQGLPMVTALGMLTLAQRIVVDSAEEEG